MLEKSIPIYKRKLSHASLLCKGATYSFIPSLVKTGTCALKDNSDVAIYLDYFLS